LYLVSTYHEKEKLIPKSSATALNNLTASKLPFSPSHRVVANLPGDVDNVDSSRLIQNFRSLCMPLHAPATSTAITQASLGVMLLAVGVKGPSGAPVAPTIKGSELTGDHRHSGSFDSHVITIAQEVVGPGGNGHFQEKTVKFGPKIGAFPVFVL
jgi:hypothetical protein